MEIRFLHQQSPKLCSQGEKKIVSGSFRFLMNGLSVQQYYTWCLEEVNTTWYRKTLQILKLFFSQLALYLILQEDILGFCQGSHFWAKKYIVRSVNCMTPSLPFFYFVICSWFRRNIVWNTLMVNKALQKSPDVGARKCIGSRKSRANIQKSVSSSKDKIISCFKLEEVQSNQSDTRWLVGWFSQGIVPYQSLSLTSAVVSCAVSKDGSQIALARDGPHRWDPCRSSVFLCTWALR